jgi:hypothetical protein
MLFSPVTHTQGCDVAAVGRNARVVGGWLNLYKNSTHPQKNDNNINKFHYPLNQCVCLA